MTIEAGKITSGMKFWDGSLIEVLSETKCFVVVRLSDGAEMLGRSIERRWSKKSKIRLKK